MFVSLPDTEPDGNPRKILDLGKKEKVGRKGMEGKTPEV